MSATTSARAYLITTVTGEPSERQDTTAGGNGRGCSGLSAASRQSSIQHCTCTGASLGVNVLYWSGPSVRVGTGASFWGSGGIPIGSASGACLEEICLGTLRISKCQPHSSPVRAPPHPSPRQPNAFRMVLLALYHLVLDAARHTNILGATAGACTAPITTGTARQPWICTKKTHLCQRGSGNHQNQRLSKPGRAATKSLGV